MKRLALAGDKTKLQVMTKERGSILVPPRR